MHSKSISHSNQKKRNRLGRQVWLLIILLTITVIGVSTKKDVGSASRGEPRPMTLSSVGRQAPTQQTRTAEQVYKNIQVFKELPASELEPTMAFISGSLGVKCSHCHTNAFEKDDKP